MAQLQQIIVADVQRGRGVVGDPIRRVTQFWSPAGDLLSESDPSGPTYHVPSGAWKFINGRYPGHHACCSMPNKPVDQCAVCTRLNAEFPINNYLEHAEKVKATLSDAWTDIGHWIQLAERQFAEMPNASHNPLAPTTAGIEASKAMRDRIGEAIKLLTDGTIE